MDITVQNCELIELKQIVDDVDGVLSVAEGSSQIPFAIRRVYYIYGIHNSKAKRGFHAHKHLEQAIFCVHGSFKLLADDGNYKQYFYLNDPNCGLYIGKKLWHTMFDFSNDCILLVIASEKYEESDYIRNYDEFIEYINED